MGTGVSYSNLPLRFGPILSVGGRRRLNVAVTRAKETMTVVSFAYTDMVANVEKDPINAESDLQHRWNLPLTPKCSSTTRSRSEAAQRTSYQVCCTAPTEPNELVSGIHERLALILHPKNYDRWLGIDGGGGHPLPPTDLLHPYDSDKMKMFPPNPAVGNVDNNGPDMLSEPDELRGR
jgi:hypothetical protein